MSKQFKQTINDTVNLKKKLIKLSPHISKAIDLITLTLKRGNKILICGNGGSAADAQHLAAEFLIRLRPNINRKPIPALSLSMDTSTLTACGNDYSSDDIFLRTFLALKSENDILFAITTSGKSKNIIKVLKEAKKQNIYSIGLLGKGGGNAKMLLNDSIIVKSNNTALIQESHIFLGHYILETVENNLIKKNFV